MNTEREAKNPPFENCQYKHCDLPGQCRGEGECHHPTKVSTAALQKRIEELEAHNEDLRQKIDADKSCACSYDASSDVCLPHSPTVAKLQKRIEELEAVISKIEHTLSVNLTAHTTYDSLKYATEQTLQALKAGDVQALDDDPPLPEQFYINYIRTLQSALKRLSFAAQTSGGTAGKDDELMAAIEQAGEALKFKAAAQAYGDVQAPKEGWKLVPIVPTKHQLTVAHQHFDDMAISIDAEQIDVIYKAMIAAAPTDTEGK